MLIAPWGGRLVDLVVPEDRAREERRAAASLPSVVLSPRTTCDLELLAVGAFSPLDRFMGKQDYERVLDEGRLASGAVFPIPVTLPVAEAPPIGTLVALRASSGEILATLRIDESFAYDPAREQRAVLATEDAAHPLVAEMKTWSRTCVSGELRVLALPRHDEFRALHRTPRHVRALLEKLGHENVVAFQTRNPLHRAHEELTKRAAERVGGALLIHPSVGLTRPGDVDAITRVRACRALVLRRYDPARTVLSLLPLAMRMAGPREALWHAVIRRNFGANHLLVGRDHAGPGKDSSGRPFYPPYAAQELVAKFADETGVRAVPFRELVYLPDEDRYVEEHEVPPGKTTLSLSGTQVREEFLARGRPLPDWFTRPEVAEVLRDAYPANERRGFCVWLTGLPAAGKSTLARAVAGVLRERGRRTSLLDADEIRPLLWKELGFSKEDRETNVTRLARVAAEVVAHEGAVVCAAVSPYRDARAKVRALVGADRFFEVFVDAPLAECEARDPKGLYARARRGEVRGLTGIDDPYEPPLAPEVHVRSSEVSPEECAARVIAVLEERAFVARDTC